MTETGDRISRRILKYIDILILKNPERTILGILLGIVLCFLTKLFEPFLNTISVITFDKVSSLEFICLGIVLVHLPFIIKNILVRPVISDEVDDVLKLIETGNFSEKEKRQIYRNLVNKCISSLSLEKKRHVINKLEGGIKIDD